jgi:hypothetical protein
MAFASSANGSLIENGSFDQFSDGKFDGWVIAPKGDVNGVSKIGTVSQGPGYPDGGSSLSLAFTGSGDYRISLTKRAPIEPGKKYRLTVNAKSSGTPVEILATFRFIGGADIEKKQKDTREIPLAFEAGTEWQSKTLDLEAGPNEMAMMLFLVVKNKTATPATVLLDEISVEPL